MSNSIAGIFVAGALIGLAACSSVTEPGAPAPLEKLPRALTGAELGVISSSNSFAFGALRETVARDATPNILISPLSASLALSMTMNGAAGETQAEMRHALGFGAQTMAQVNEANESLTELLLGVDANVDMRIANSIWARTGFPFERSFLDTGRRWYSAQVTTLDFAAPTAAATINEWVNRSTRGKISSIVENPLPADAVMYLINAVYFKGSWRDRFERSATRDAPFTTRDGAVKQVRMMSRGGPAYHAQIGGVQILEQVYSRGAFAMTIVLPPAGTDVDALLSSLDAETWHTWTGALTEREVDVSMPAYRIEYRTIMNDALQALGMRRAFVPRGADFTPMSPEGRELFISLVQQKTFMDVNEEGTEAAAVTSVEISVTSAPVRQQFVVDRPFIVAIRERFSGAILFIGRVGDPTAG